MIWVACMSLFEDLPGTVWFRGHARTGLHLILASLAIIWRAWLLAWPCYFQSPLLLYLYLLSLISHISSFHSTFSIQYILTLIFLSGNNIFTINLHQALILLINIYYDCAFSIQLKKPKLYILFNHDYDWYYNFYSLDIWYKY